MKENSELQLLNLNGNIVKMTWEEYIEFCESLRED